MQRELECNMKRDAEPCRTQTARTEKGGTEYNERECMGKNNGT